MRVSGILLPVSSLPSRYGIGCFDRSAYEFVDQLAEAGQHIWQILPLGPIGYGDSPYQSFSTYAGNPYYISLDALVEQGLLTAEECAAAHLEGEDPRLVDYGRQYTGRYPLLRLAYHRSHHQTDPDFRAFCQEQDFWLEDYALFMAIKASLGGVALGSWPGPLRRRDPAALEGQRQNLAEEIDFQRFLQYLFRRQWQQLKAYANGKGVRILGDIPIYVSMDSADTWVQPELFQLDEDLRPVAVAGCPPDAFAENGQVWGNPLYRWDYHQSTGFAWWLSRIRASFQLYDILRIDHFRGFDEYFSIPAGEDTARNGHWESAPGRELFRTVQQTLGTLDIVAEDLGYVTDSVRALVQETGFPGMKVLEFAFDSRDTGSAADYLTYNYPVNSVAYTGTHDNATLVGWFGEITPAEREMVRDYVWNHTAPMEELYWDMICTVMRSTARTCIVPMQDYLGLGNEARINRPSTLGQNWRWRLLPGQFTPELRGQIARITACFGRA